MGDGNIQRVSVSCGPRGEPESLSGQVSSICCKETFKAIGKQSGSRIQERQECTERGALVGPDEMV